jgi:hypothetical protein
LSSLAGSRCQCCDAAFERCHALLKNVGGGIHDPGINISELAQTEKVRCMFGAVKTIGSGLINRNRACVCVRVNLLACVKL